MNAQECSSLVAVRVQARADKKLFTPAHLNQRRGLMNSLHLLAETKVLGLVVNPWKIVGWTGSLIFGKKAGSLRIYALPTGTGS